MLDANTPQDSETIVSRWFFEAASGQISARDSCGNLVMAIAADALFAARMAAAFSTPSFASRQQMRNGGSPGR